MSNNIVTFRSDADINEGLEIIQKYLKDRSPGTKIKRSDAIRFAIAMSTLSIIQEEKRQEERRNE